MVNTFLLVFLPRDVDCRLELILFFHTSLFLWSIYLIWNTSLRNCLLYFPFPVFYELLLLVRPCFTHFPGEIRLDYSIHQTQPPQYSFLYLYQQRFYPSVFSENFISNLCFIDFPSIVCRNLMSAAFNWLLFFVSV